MNQYRKNVRLPHYDYRTNGAYFITIVCHKRIPYFDQTLACADQTAHILHAAYDAIEKRYPYIEIIEQIIMPDHIHFVLMIDGDDDIENRVHLSGVIQYFKSVCTRSYIEQVKTQKLPPFKEKIWQKGYYEHIVRSDKELNTIREYIQANPMKLEELKESWKRKK